MSTFLARFFSIFLLAAVGSAYAADHLVFEGGDGPGRGKHIVFLAGDEEYRSEEAMPLMAEIMAKQGFKCTVNFSVNPDGIVNPDRGDSMSNAGALDSADAIVMSLRFRGYPEPIMEKFDNALQRGIPIVALRTSTHAFNGVKGKYAKYNFNAKKDTGWDRGFGRHVLGETWVNHHGHHKKEGTRSKVEAANKGHEVLNGVGTIFGDTDVYGAHPPADVKILLRGEVTQTLKSDSPPVAGKKNDPMMPVLWTREYKNRSGKTNRIVCTTMGSSTDLADENLRRAVANGVYWGLKMTVPAKADVTLPGPFKPSMYSFGGYQKNKRPADFVLGGTPSVAAAAPAAAAKPAPTSLAVTKGTRIFMIGGGLGSRMTHYNHFETELYQRYPDADLVIRNMCDEGNTPSFRPHSGRSDQLGFPGADQFIAPYCQGRVTNGVGHLETDEAWMKRLKPDIVLAFFGFSESFHGRRNLANYRAELDAFLKHTLKTAYNGNAAPALALVSPTAFQDLSDRQDTPNGRRENRNLAAYTAVMQEVAAQNGVLFVDAFNESLKWYAASKDALTADSALLNDAGYAKLAPFLADSVFGKAAAKGDRNKVHSAVTEKNWLWVNDFKIPNGVHVFGRRYKPFGPKNYPDEIKKIREMTDVRDQAIWAACKGKSLDVAGLDANTHKLPTVPTNYKPGGKNGTLKFLQGDAALQTIKVPEGYKIEQWATEKEFPNLANPVQMAHDNKGRLWIATMPSYPHWRPGDPRPDDKLIVLEDTNGDGKADKETVWADNLHLPMGFEISHDGVYVSQGVNLVLLKDTDGDDKADYKEVVFSGFDDHDTHHAIGAYCADPSGAFIMCEGVFLRTSVDTPYGTIRGTDGGFFRYAPQRRHLERHAQLSIPNPWGVAFDDWGQHFFLHTSGPTTEWMLPGSVKPRYGVKTPKVKGLLQGNARVRPTSGIEFLVSSHFPDEVQGDMLINNNIGFRGTKQHKMLEDGTGYTTEFRHDLTVSSDGNFRPVDCEVAPDGSLMIVDWHNPLIGHMQHNARDPHRDHGHGRIYRVTYPGRPLVKPATIAGASIPQLLENLKLHEYRSRYRTRRELRKHDAAEVVAAAAKWAAKLDKSDANYEHHLLEALWVTWGANKVDQGLLNTLLKAEDHRARAAAVRVLRYTGHQVADQAELLKVAATDSHGRVKLEAVVAGSWLTKDEGLAVLAAAEGAKVPEKTDDPAKKGEYVKVSPGGKIIEVKHPAIADSKVTNFRLSVKGNREINLSELEIYSGGKNIVKTAKLKQSSEYNGGQFPVKLLVDGKKDNFTHTAVQRNPWITGEFPAGVSISSFKLWNRPDFESRFDGGKIEFFNGTKLLASVNVKIEGGKGGGGGGGGPFGDDWLDKPFVTAKSHLNDTAAKEPPKPKLVTKLRGGDKKLFIKGHEIYEREGHCGTCHQPDGNGLPAAGFPPLAGSKWATQDEERLIKLTLKGLHGPIEVKGTKYPGLVPMTPFEGMLNDEDIAAVLTFVRNAFGNNARPIEPGDVKKVRAKVKGKTGFYSPDELLKAHPHK
jgi:mono/diheme cytochrome c family protein/glucose/arabinose dehydrogenase/lysophospholipase L1-like esterase